MDSAAPLLLRGPLPQLDDRPLSRYRPPHRFDWVAFPLETIALVELTFESRF